jgi:ribokinase
VTGVLKVADKPTATAIIVLTPDGENSIDVVPGANAALTAAWIFEAGSRLAAVAIVSAQTEVGDPVVDAAATLAFDVRARFQLNVSPIVDLAAATYAASDPLVVNEHEANELCGRRPPNEPTTLAAMLRRRTRARSVIVTLGAAGTVIEHRQDNGARSRCLG